MTIPAWSSPFTDNVSVVVASFLNWIRTNLPSALDGVGGGPSTPTAAIEVNGAGFKSDNIGDSTVTGALTIDGDVTFASSGTTSSGPDRRIAERIDTTTLSDANVNVHANGARADVYRFAGAITANRIWTLQDADEGEVIRIITDQTGAGAVTISYNAATIATFPAGGAVVGATPFLWADFVCTATGWEYLCSHPEVAP